MYIIKQIRDWMLVLYFSSVDHKYSSELKIVASRQKT